MEIILDFNHNSVAHWYYDFKDNAECVQCGEQNSKKLEFHHLDPWEKKSSVARLVYDKRPLREVQAEINKCEILCTPCHRKEHIRNREWYESRIALRRIYGTREGIQSRRKLAA